MSASQLLHHPGERLANCISLSLSLVHTGSHAYALTSHTKAHTHAHPHASVNENKTHKHDRRELVTLLPLLLETDAGVCVWGGGRRLQEDESREARGEDVALPQAD